FVGRHVERPRRVEDIGGISRGGHPLGRRSICKRAPARLGTPSRSRVPSNTVGAAHQPPEYASMPHSGLNQFRRGKLSASADFLVRANASNQVRRMATSYMKL